jgi:PIN domain nuclease of toxin-antitoxin system
MLACLASFPAAICFAGLAALPRRHRDPFDRMLIAQARAERLALLTRDRAIIAYGTAGAEVVTFDG